MHLNSGYDPFHQRPVSTAILNVTTANIDPEIAPVLQGHPRRWSATPTSRIMPAANASDRTPPAREPEHVARCSIEHDRRAVEAESSNPSSIARCTRSPTVTAGAAPRRLIFLRRADFSRGPTL